MFLYFYSEKVRENGKSWTGTDDICSVVFDEDVKDLKMEDVGFGVKYNFTLKDAVDGCPEYLINNNLLEEICKEFHLENKR